MSVWINGGPCGGGHVLWISSSRCGRLWWCCSSELRLPGLVGLTGDMGVSSTTAAAGLVFSSAMMLVQSDLFSAIVSLRKVSLSWEYWGNRTAPSWDGESRGEMIGRGGAAPAVCMHGLMFSACGLVATGSQASSSGLLDPAPRRRRGWNTLPRGALCAPEMGRPSQGNFCGGAWQAPNLGSVQPLPGTTRTQ